MNTMTLLEDYVEALLDGALADVLPFDRDRPDGPAGDREPRAAAVIAGAAAETAAAADNAAMPPSAADPMSPPALDRRPEPAPCVPQAPPPAFVPAFVPSAAPAAVDNAVAPHEAPASAKAASHRWLRVTVGNDSYALELLRVQEVVRLAPFVALRGASRAVLGVMNLRGRIVPVVDLGLWLDAGCVHSDEGSRIVVIERADEMIGVLVTAVEDVVTLGRERIEPPLPSSDPGAIVGIARVGAAPTVLLNANALFG